MQRSDTLYTGAVSENSKGAEAVEQNQTFHGLVWWIFLVGQSWIFSIAKLWGHIDWGWQWVFSPIIFWIAIVFTFATLQQIFQGIQAGKGKP